MRNMFVIFRKELYRVLTDKRLVLTVFILPGLSIFVIYTIIGTLVQAQFTEPEDYETKIYAENVPDAIVHRLDETMNYRFIEGELTRDDIEEQIMDEKIDLAVIFAEDFEERIIDKSPNPPGVTVFYNQGNQSSASAHTRFSAVMNAYHESIIKERLDDPADYHPYILATENIIDERTMAAQGFAMLLPMLIIIFLFAGAMSIGPDAIAGEKERGTIASLLVTPTKRRDIALGKVTSSALLSLLSALSAFIGIILSLPRLMMADETMPDISIYGAQEFLAIFFLLVVTVIFIVGLISIISAYAKTIKEASMLIMPFYFIAMIIGIMNSFGAEVNQNPLVHLVPIYGPINMLSGVLLFDYSLTNFFVTIAANIVYIAVFVFILNKMFDNEKVMFAR